MVDKILKLIFGSNHYVFETNWANKNLDKEIKVVNIIGPPAVGKSTSIEKQLDDSVLRLSRKKLLNPLDNDGIYNHLLKTHCKRIRTLKEFNDRISDVIYDSNIVEMSIFENDVVLIDQGIPHFFYRELINLYEKDKDAFKSFVSRRGLVLLVAEPEVILKRKKRREDETGKLIKSHSGKTDSEIIDFTRNITSMYKKLFSCYEKCGAYTHLVDISNRELSL